MNQETRNHELIVQYLLAELSEQEKMLLEQRYFDDDDFFEQLLVVEGELIDAYVRGELSGHKRARFEARVLASPRQRQRVELARALVEYATESSVPVSPVAVKRKPAIWLGAMLDFLGAKNRAIGLAFATAVVVILVGGSLLIVQTFRLRNQVQRIQADRTELLRHEQELQRQLGEQGAQNEQLASELQRERIERELLEQNQTKPQRTTRSIITFMLTPDLVRGASEPKRLIIPQRAELVRMLLDLDHDDHKSYRAAFETVEGKRIWSSGSLKARSKNAGKMVTLKLPASLFASGDYILTLSGINADGSLENADEYYFNVVKE